MQHEEDEFVITYVCFAIRWYFIAFMAKGLLLEIVDP